MQFHKNVSYFYSANKALVMAWISGRTISPASGQLVFTIDEDARLPGPQHWEQMWSVCEGIPPIVVVEEPAEPPRYVDALNAGNRCGPCSQEDGWIGEYIAVTADRPRSFADVEPRDVDPMSQCESYRRTLTYSVPNFDIQEGGDAVAETTGCIGRQCDTISIALKIRGQNPSRDTLNSAFPNDILRAIGWQESRWRHFLPNGKPIVNRNTNGTADWGLMQINEASPEAQWNWKTNLNRAIALLAEKRTHAQAYLNRHPPYTPDMLENEMIQRYNGGAYYRWDASSNSWQAQPPNGYVALIRSFMTSRPW